MPSSFQNPRNPLAAMWASAVEAHLRRENPELTIGEIRRLPMMLGVYEHLSHLKKKERLSPPSGAGEEGALPATTPQAYLSQAFFDLTVTSAGLSETGIDYYEAYTTLLDSFNDSHDITDFSTDDILGFALCLIVWLGMTGLKGLSYLERYFLDYLMRWLPLTPEQKEKIKDFWVTMTRVDYKVQYRDAADYPKYDVIPWKIPAGAQIVMLGDWGTSMDDAHQFLYAIWKQAFLNNKAAPVVFLHLGDIYYCGLPIECQSNFKDVFVTVGQQLSKDLNDKQFNPNPPVFTIPGNHEYYSFGYGYFQLLDSLNKNVPNISPADIYQQCSFFCLRTADNKWQFLGMDTGQADGNALLAALEGLGDAVGNAMSGVIPNWSWLNSIGGLAESTYEDFVGPFQPHLRPNEVTWLKKQLDGFTGKTIMLSHHQLFSREAKINHDSPEFMNTWLDRTFNSYYKKNIAAWFWGHEHSFAAYLDGLMGLNKGRLLGSSSYEATEAADTPYADNYPMVPLSSNMTDTTIKMNSDDLYYHAGAILSQSGSDMSVTYHQFPAWSQLDTPPQNPQLIDVPGMNEKITTSFKSLKATWIGNKTIDSSKINTSQGVAGASVRNYTYMLYSDGRSGSSEKLTLCYLDPFKPTSSSSTPFSSQPINILVDGNNVKTSKTPAMININDSLYGFYIDSSGYIQGICWGYPGGANEVWTSLGKLPNQTTSCPPAVCFFQGRIYIVYVQQKSNNIGWGFYDITSKSWHDYGALKDFVGNQLTTESALALSADAFHIYMCYQTKGGHNIRWAVGTPSSPLPSGTANNISWDDAGVIKTASNGGQKTPQVSRGMTLTLINGVFFLTYVSTNNHNLVQCALDGSGKDSTGTWIGNNTMKANANSKNSSTPRSSQCPAMIETDGGAFVLYRGDSHSAIYWAYY